MDKTWVDKNDVEVTYYRINPFVNEDDQAVRLVHRPTGIEVRCQDNVPRSLNLRKAMVELEIQIRDDYFKQKRNMIKNKLREKEKQRLNRRRRPGTSPAPRYDEVYFEGVKWLDSLACTDDAAMKDLFEEYYLVQDDSSESTKPVQLELDFKE